MGWLDIVRYGSTMGCQRVAERYKNLYKHPALPGVLLRSVANAADLKLNCQGFLIFNASNQILGGYVGKSADLMMARESFGLPYSVPGISNMANNVDFQILSAHGDSDYAGKPIGTISGNGGDSARAMTPQGFTALSTLNMTSGRTYTNPQRGTVLRRLRAANPVGLPSFTAGGTPYYIMGIITRASDGMFYFGQALSNTAPTTEPVKWPVTVGWMADEFNVGEIGKIVAANKAKLLADCPSDVQKYYARAIDAFVASEGAKRIGKLTFATTWQMVGTVGNWTRSHGLPIPTAYTSQVRGSNSDLGILEERWIDFPTIDNPWVMPAFRVREVADALDKSAFSSLATGHAMAAAINAETDKFAPLELGGETMESIMSYLGWLWEAMDSFGKAQISYSTVLVTDGTPNQTASVGSLGAVTGTSTLFDSLYDHKLGHPMFLELQKAMATIYKRAEREIKD